LNKQLLTKDYQFLIIVCLLTVYGCSSSLVNIKTDAHTAGFQSQLIPTDKFDLFAFIKNDDVNADKLVVYIEGDGHAWTRRNVLSSDPTPENPVSLKLAINDPRPLILYLARPCQYLPKTKLVDCPSRFWSTHRYSTSVVDSINEAITKIKSQSSVSSIELIGYSGGGVIAMLVASLRNDISRIVTVASNIDHESWSAWHGVSRLEGSLKPMNILMQLQDISQLHLWGDKDKVVPFKTQKLFVENSGVSKLFNYMVIPNFTHDCCWVDQWQETLRL
jgi:hypothetical protein